MSSKIQMTKYQNRSKQAMGDYLMVQDVRQFGHLMFDIALTFGFWALTLKTMAQATCAILEGKSIHKSKRQRGFFGTA